MTPAPTTTPPELPAWATQRCIRRGDCVDAVRVTPGGGDQPYQLGAPATAAFCPTCARYVGYAIAGLPYDVAELGVLLRPTMAVRYRDPNMPTQPRVKLHSPMPLNGDALALQQLIDHETTSWAASVAEFAGVPWDTTVERHRPMLDRVHTACQLLAYRSDWLLGMPPVWHRVRSAGAERLDGWPDHLVERMQVTPDGEIWVHRDGPEGALALLDLHQLVLGHVGHTTHDRLRTPCPDCGRSALVREHRVCTVVCRRCFHSMSDDAYDRHITDLSARLGVRP